jgi:glyoxylase-like metal-dependent hydrolase (beta-lactamase superfamily II)
VNLRRALNDLHIDDSQIRFIIPTHVHLDHAGGAGRLLQAFPEAELLVHPRGARHLINPERLIASTVAVYGEDTFRALYGEIVPAPAERTRELADGETVQIGERRLQVLHTRGHAEHHLCLWDEQTRGWFSGDMFGICYGNMRFIHGDFLLPATTPTQFDPQAYEHSLRALAARQPRVVYLTHYGALPYREQQVEGLCTQLRLYAALGARLGPDIAALQDAVLAAAQEQLQALTDDAEAEAVAQSLHMDARLNAQGIAWRETAKNEHTDTHHHGASTA